MRIYFKTLTLPKKAAKRIQSHYSKDGISIEPMQLSQAQAIASWMLGYESWHELELELETKSQSHPPSPTDENCSPEEQRNRLGYQTEVLKNLTPLIESQRKRLAIKFRVSASNPKSPELLFQSFSNNRLELCENDHADKPEWRFFASERCTEAQETLWDDIEMYERGQMVFGAFNELMFKHIAERPEDLRAMEWVLSEAIEKDYYDFVEERLDDFEKVFIAAIPDDFPKRQKVFFQWYTHENRPFHRAMYNLACCYYYKGNYTKAKKWFNFTYRTCEQLEHSCKPYLDDLRSDSPGNVDLEDVY